MATIADAAALLEQIAPARLAEEWDNVGLLTGDPAGPLRRVMTCLTVTPDSAAEAIDRGADLLVSHHPLPFRPLRRLTTDAVEGRLLWGLCRAAVAIYSPHTAFDSAAEGINRRLADGLGLADARPLTPHREDATLGAGRVATPPAGATAQSLAEAAKAMLDIDHARLVGRPDAAVTRVALACGSGASMLDAAVAAGCDALVTGEATFHNCLAAEARGVALLLVGHYASERFAVEALAQELAAGLPGVEAWASRREHDPIRLV
ncbi:MAG: Nif3-like dinuclear metal center hexameric protein [Planctomycetota bacterium]